MSAARYATLPARDHDQEENAPLLGEPAIAPSMTLRTLRTLHIINTIVAGIFTVACGTVMFYAFDSCNKLLTAFLVVSTIDNAWTTVRGIVRLVLQDVPTMVHAYAFGVCFMKLWFAGMFTLFAFMDGKHCGNELLTTTRVTSSAMFIWAMFMYDLNEHIAISAC